MPALKRTVKYRPTDSAVLALLTAPALGVPQGHFHPALALDPFAPASGTPPPLAHYLASPLAMQPGSNVCKDSNSNSSNSSITKQGSAAHGSGCTPRPKPTRNTT